MNPNAKKIYSDKADVFHTTIDKSLFLCKRARPDIQPTVPFLCTRVKVPDEYEKVINNDHVYPRNTI